MAANTIHTAITLSSYLQEYASVCPVHCTLTWITTADENHKGANILIMIYVAMRASHTVLYASGMPSDIRTYVNKGSVGTQS